MFYKSYFKPKGYLALCALTITISSCTPSATQEETISETVVKEVIPEKPTIVYDTANPISLVQSVAEAMGGLEALKALNDVQYDYTYFDTPNDKKDISIEKYIFSDESSWASYSQHEVNVSPDKEGPIVQYYDGEKAYVSYNGEKMEDEGMVGMSHFLRKANYFWFTMMYKLADPGTVHEYMGNQEIEGVKYDKVLVTYDPATTGKEVNDTYILYVNPETHMVNRFLFSLPALGVNEPVLLMEVDYKEIEGIQVSVARRGYQSDGNGNASGDAFVVQSLDNIKFNNGLTQAEFAL